MFISIPVFKFFEFNKANYLLLAGIVLMMICNCMNKFIATMLIICLGLHFLQNLINDIELKYKISKAALILNVFAVIIAFGMLIYNFVITILGG